MRKIACKLDIMVVGIKWLLRHLLWFQGQFRNSPGAGQGQTGAGRLPGQFKEGADEGGLPGAHAGAEGSVDPPLLTYGGDARRTLSPHPSLVFYRTKRSRSWQRSATSWSPRWGRVSERTSAKSTLAGWSVETLLDGDSSNKDGRTSCCWRAERLHGNGFS